MYKDKESQKEANRIASQRLRDKQKGMTQEGMTTPVYDHDLTVREAVTLHTQRTQDQVDRFPNIPLPFGQAYYKALSEMKVKYA